MYVLSYSKFHVRCYAIQIIVLLQKKIKLVVSVYISMTIFVINQVTNMVKEKNSLNFFW